MCFVLRVFFFVLKSRTYEGGKNRGKEKAAGILGVEDEREKPSKTIKKTSNGFVAWRIQCGSAISREERQDSIVLLTNRTNR